MARPTKPKRETNPFVIHVCRVCQCIVADDHWDRHPRECRGPLVITPEANAALAAAYDRYYALEDRSDGPPDQVH